VSKPLILLVEDEPVMRRVLIVAMRGHGYAVAEAADGNQALAEVKAQSPQVIILDLGLPDMDGVEVAKRVRREHEVPIIVLSARGEEQQQIRALDAGANDYVIKPCLRRRTCGHAPAPPTRGVGSLSRGGGAVLEGVHEAIA
jgi:two-component system KDP operon response regulator KdpE